MQRVAAIFMVLCYTALGSGAVEHWHNLQHAAEDAVVLSAAREAGMPLDHAPVHDESNCELHSQLHVSAMAVAWVPLLIFLGLFVAFLTLLAPRMVAQQVAFASFCRGPPIR